MTDPQALHLTPTIVPEDIITRYFSRKSRAKAITQSTHKIQTMIEQGKLQIKPETPFPFRQSKSFKLPPHLSSEKKTVIRLKTQPSPKSKQQPRLNQLSAKNKRFLESLLLKYNNFTSSVQKLPVQPDEAITRQTFDRICYYEQILEKSSNRLPTTPQQQSFLEETPFNLRLSFEMDKDLDQLKRYARQFNCSLHRKNKYYECLEDIRKKISSINPPRQEERDESRLRYREARVKVPQISQRKVKGNEYLQYSRDIGLQSKKMYERERGNVKFLKEVVHHWWGNDTREQASHSTLS